MNVRAHVFYSGNVQGVGFRYTAQRLACELDLTGWVKNLSDGRVEMVVVGPKPQIVKLLERLENHFSGSVRSQDISFSDPMEQFKDFSVTL